MPPAQRKPNFNLAQQIKDGLEKKQAEREQQDQLAELVKPRIQELGVPGMPSGTIHWVWDGLVGCSIDAYYRPANEESTPKYDVQIQFDDDSPLVLDSEAAKNIGAALLSAHLWESVWQQHAGEFLA